MDPDVRHRGSRGLVCSLQRLADGKLRVVLDDVKNSRDGLQGPWTHSSLFTQKDYDRAVLEEMELSDAEFASFGQFVIARLLAQLELAERSRGKA